jgi:hypothetical protein
MFKQCLVVFGILLISIFQISAQDSDTRTYNSENGAVQFSFSGEWTLEDQGITFNTLYRFALWTPKYLPMAPQDRSRILIEFINSETNDYAQDFETAEDFAGYIIGTEEVVNANFTETEIAGNSAVRSSSLSGDRIIVMYTIFRDDSWAVVASINAPTSPPSYQDNDLESGEEALISILESLVFDSEAAATPFERNLEVYDTSDIKLGENYSSDDGMITLQYPSEWEIKDTSELTDFTAIIVYFIEFELPNENIEISFSIIEIGSEALNPARDADTTEEYLHALRYSEESEVKQFQIGEFDAVSGRATEGEESRQIITYAINDEWITQSSVTAISNELLEQYEASVVAIMESINFTIGAGFIAFPFFNVDLPQPWEVASAYTENETSEFVLQSSDETKFQDAAIFLFLENLEDAGLSEAAEEGLETLLANISTIEYETEIITIDDYEVLRGGTSSVTASNGRVYYLGISLTIVNDNWVFAAYAQSSQEEDIPIMLQDISTIIADMEITFRED